MKGKDANSYLEGVLDGIIKGRKEVVGFDAPSFISNLKTGSCFIPIGKDKWQTKLEEWGIGSND